MFWLALGSCKVGPFQGPVGEDEQFAATSRLSLVGNFHRLYAQVDAVCPPTSCQAATVGQAGWLDLPGGLGVPLPHILFGVDAFGIMTDGFCVLHRASYVL